MSCNKCHKGRANMSGHEMRWCSGKCDAPALPHVLNEIEEAYRVNGFPELKRWAAGIRRSLERAGREGT